MITETAIWYLAIYDPKESCIDGRGHSIKWEPAKTSAGINGSFDEVCLKCGVTIRENIITR